MIREVGEILQFATQNYKRENELSDYILREY